MKWSDIEFGLLVRFYPRYGIRHTMRVIPRHNRRRIEAMIRKLGLRRTYKPRRIEIRAAHLRWYLIAQDYFIRRDLNRPRTTSPAASP